MPTIKGEKRNLASRRKYGRFRMFHVDFCKVSFAIYTVHGENAKAARVC